MGCLLWVFGRPYHYGTVPYVGVTDVVMISVFSLIVPQSPLPVMRQLQWTTLTDLIITALIGHQWREWPLAILLLLRVWLVVGISSWRIICMINTHIHIGLQQYTQSTTHQYLNSLVLGRFLWNFKLVFFKLILLIDGWDVSCEIVLRWM